MSYCYDDADRLVSDTVGHAPSGASPLLAANLTSTGSTPDLAYDSHGDITILGDESMVYDETGRHLSTTTGALASSVTYTRDATGRVISMVTTGATPGSVEYSYTNAGVCSSRSIPARARTRCRTRACRCRVG